MSTTQASPRRFFWIPLVAFMTAATMAHAGAHPDARTGWLIGFSLGGGSAGVSGDNVTSDREGGGAASFRGGYAFNEDISLELDGSAWSKEQDGVTVSFTAATVAINFYPGHTGFVLRAGVGSGSADATVDLGSTTVTGSQSGLGVLVGAGYEFRVLRTFALGPQVDFGFASVDDFDVNWVNVGLGFTWYFPKQ